MQNDFFCKWWQCGSTTLAMLLKHRPPDYDFYDKSGPFVDAGKELCLLQVCTEDHPWALDACPHTANEKTIRAWSLFEKETVVVVMFRPQEDALLSYYNDRASSGYLTADADTWVREHAAFTKNHRFNFETVLEKVIKYQVVVVDNADMKNVDKIMTDFGTVMNERFINYRVIYANNANGGGSRYRYVCSSSLYHFLMPSQFKSVRTGYLEGFQPQILGSCL